MFIPWLSLVTMSTSLYGMTVSHQGLFGYHVNKFVWDDCYSPRTVWLPCQQVCAGHLSQYCLCLHVLHYRLCASFYNPDSPEMKMKGFCWWTFHQLISVFIVIIQCRTAAAITKVNASICVWENAMHQLNPIFTVIIPYRAPAVGGCNWG